MIDPVKSVASNSLLEPIVGAGVSCRRQRHRSMKASIEDCYLTDFTQQFCDDLHPFKFGSIVQRGKYRDVLNRRLDRGCNDRRLEKILPAVHNPAPYNIDIG